MIVTSESLEMQSNKAQEAQAESAQNKDRTSEVPPPPYESPNPPPSANPSDGSTSSGLNNVVPRPKATNYVWLIRPNSSIRESFTINPYLNMPSSLLPPLERGVERKNLKLEARNGSIDTSVLLVSDSEEGGKKEGRRATLDVASHNGSVSVKLRTETPPSLTYQLKVLSYNGSVSVHLPRNFRGLLTITAGNGSINYSAGLEPHVTAISEMRNVRKAFVGELFTEDEWNGDEAIIESRNGRIKVQYVDEVQLSATGSKKGFFSRFL